MSVIEKLKKETMRVRRDMGAMASFAQFTLSEVRNIGKNNGNRDTTEEEAINYIKKQIEKTKSVIDVATEHSMITKLSSEINFLEDVISDVKMLSEEEVLNYLRTNTDSSMNKGQIMKKLKENFGPRVDMKKANQLVSILYES